MAVAAITLSSCGGNKAEATEDGADTLNVEAPASMDEADAVASELSAALESADAAQTTSVIAQAQEKIQALINEGNVEQAKVYAEKVQTFLNENAEKIKSVGVDVTPVTNLLQTVTNAAAGTVSAAEETANGAVEAAKAAGEQKVEEAKTKATDAVNAEVDKAQQKANEAVNNAATKATEEVTKGVGKLLGK